MKNNIFTICCLRLKSVILNKYQNILKGSFTLAVVIYFFNSVGNVSQGVFIKYYQEKLQMGLYEFMTLRCIMEVIILFPFAFKYLKHFRQNLPIVLLLSCLYSIDMLLFHRGLKTVPISTGALIMLLVPIWIVIFGRIILKENKFNFVNALCLLLCLFGIFFTMFKEIQFAGFNVGYLFLIADSIAIPLGLILQKKYAEFRPVIYAIFTNAIVLSVLGFAMSGCHLPSISYENVKGATIVAICDIMEVACVYIAYKMTDCALLQPVRFTRVFLGMIMGYCFLNEKINTYQFIGAIIVVSANVFSIIYERKREKRQLRYSTANLTTKTI